MIERISMTLTKRTAAEFFASALAATWLTFTTGPAFAGPPFQTDDPEPVDLHHYEFYVATQQTLTSDGRTGTLPHFEFNYGVAQDVQLHLIAPVAFSNPSGGTHERGFGDTELGIKYRFLQEGDTTPMQMRPQH